jgi:hypothetical protein
MSTWSAFILVWVAGIAGGVILCQVIDGARAFDVPCPGWNCSEGFDQRAIDKGEIHQEQRDPCGQR